MTHEHIRKAKSRTAYRDMDAALRRLEPRLAAAFLAAARAIKDKAKIGEISRAIERGDLEQAIELAGAAQIGERLRGSGLEPGERSAVDELTEALREGSAAGMRQMPRQAALAASLDLTNPEAVRYLREHVPALVTNVSDEAREAVRQAVLRGFEEGRPPLAIAREVKESVGLTRPQQRFVANFRRQLETGNMGAGTAPWDRRLSATERQQARSIFAVGGEESARVNALVDRYAESLLNRRSQDIARTEIHRAFVEGQTELWRQAEDQGLMDRRTVRRVWIVTPDDRLRPDHAAVPGMNPDGVGLDQPFDTPVGPVMAPGESGDGSFDINCFLPGTLVRGSFVAGLESRYSGEAVEIITAGGKRLAITPNHPVLTLTGLVPAGRLSEGQYLITDRFEIVDGSTGAEEDQNRPSVIEDVFQALSVSGVILLPVTAVNLHGDEVCIEDDIRQVGADGFLEGRYFSGVREQLRQRALVSADISARFGVGHGASATFIQCTPFSSDSTVGRRDLPTALLVGHLAPFEPLRVGSPADMDALFSEYPRDRVAGDPEIITQFLERGSRLVSSDEIVRIRRYPFSGHVYDLQSTTGLLSAGSIITSNCRCTVALEFLD